MSVLSIVWCLEKCVILFGSNSLKVWVLFDMNSDKCAVSFGSSSLKLSTLFDMKSEKVFTIVGSNCWIAWVLFCFLGQIFYNFVL